MSDKLVEWLHASMNQHGNSPPGEVWAEHEHLIKELKQQQITIDRLHDLVYFLWDEDDCQLDKNGACVVHGWQGYGSGLCPHAVAKAILPYSIGDLQHADWKGWVDEHNERKRSEHENSDS